MTWEPTPIQHERCTELEAGGRTVYLGHYQGQTVVSAFRRYVQSDDPLKINAPLRDFLMMVCGFIAHFDLHGFRAAYPRALLLLEDLEADCGLMGMLRRGCRRPEHVYADGMTDAEVCNELASIAAELGDQARRNAAAAIAERVTGQLISGARLLGWALVPPGFTPVPLEAGEASSEGLPPEVRDLAARRGLSLIPEGRLI